MKHFIYTLIICVGLYACNSNSSEKDNTNSKSPVTPKAYDYSLASKDSNAVQDGESIIKYKNGIIKMRGMMKAGKRDGPWQSWYDNGLQWSESIYDNGIKNGKTTTWFPNGQKRYDGYYSNDRQSGLWTYYNEQGKKINSQNYESK